MSSFKESFEGSEDFNDVDEKQEEEYKNTLAC